MKTLLKRAHTAVKGGWNAILGISAELLLTAIITGVCFLVCFVWWAVTQ